MTTPGTIQNGVLFGEDGELYLAHGGHSVLDFATGRRQVSDEMFAIFEANVLGRAARCAAYGAKYLHLIFPDKQSVVRERFPFNNPVCLGLLYDQNCPSVSKHVRNLTEVLRREPSAVFKKTDTHLNDYGMALAASMIVETITGQQRSTVLEQFTSRPVAVQTAAGDLGMKVVPQLQSEDRSIIANWPLHFFSNGVGFGNDGLIDIYVSPSSLSKIRLVWFGDSFGRGCVRLLSLFFREIVFLRTRYFHEEIVFQIRPDVVVTENVERYLDVVAPDEEAPPFLLYPLLKGLAYAPSASFCEAMAAILSYPRSTYTSFVSGLA